MSFCSNCGKPISSGSRFCSECGAPAASSSAGTYNVRREVFVGEVRKCPACGAEVNSFTAYCPECGHEFNFQTIPYSIKDFTNKLQIYDNSIIYFNPILPNKPQSSKKNTSVSPITAFALFVVIVGMAPFMMMIIEDYIFYFLMITYSIIILLINIRLHRKSIGVKEREKASFINNYVFTSDREVIISALEIFKEQLLGLNVENINYSSFYWAKIWKNKAIVLHKKAKMLLKNDEIESIQFKEIISVSREIYKRFILKKILLFCLELAPIIALIFLEKSWLIDHKHIFD